MLTEQQPAPATAPYAAVRDRPVRLAVLCDYPEELWPSMDLCAAMFLEQARARQDVSVTRICPPFRRRLGRLPGIGGRSWARNADRFLNRHWDYPRHLRTRRNDQDVFHICDHSYSQLACELPGTHTGILCHDVDAFRCLAEPLRDHRPRWYRWMMRRVLAGMQQAAVVFHTTAAVKQEILRFGLIDAKKLVQAPLGYAPEFSAEPRSDPVAEQILAGLGGRPFVMHVGSCTRRKRVDFLLRVFANLRRRLPELWLVKVGGTWSAEHQDCIQRNGLAAAIQHAHGLDRQTLAALYRKTNLLMITSEAEGFGLPALEGLACGAPVLVSDLAVFREVGGDALVYAPLLQLDAWCETAARILAHSALIPAAHVRLAQAQKFSWTEHARIILDTYRRLAA